MNSNSNRVDCIAFALMGWEKWAQGEKKMTTTSILTPSFHTLSLTLLNLLFPLSFLLLAKLSILPHLLTFTPSPTPTSLIFSLFLHTNPPLIHSLILLICVFAVSHALTDRVLPPPLYVAWALLCLFQFCVGLGIEATINAGVWPVHISNGNGTWLRRGLLFVGLYETMVFWSRIVVRPVVDDTIYGVVKEETHVERVASAFAFGALWWWRLRDEVEVLVGIVDLKKEMLVEIGVVDIVCWMVYYQLVAMGVVRFVKGFVWVGRIMIRGVQLEKSFGGDCDVDCKV